ncbi:MAG: hypothetical protein ABEJ76_01990 [Halanaeroarchaeum sp.]
MAVKWHTNLPAEWDDAPSDPPEEEPDSVIEEYRNGVVLRPLEASVDQRPTGAYLYCDAETVRSLDEDAL